jgi:oxaloacetate decarboxylase gamma subunit
MTIVDMLGQSGVLTLLGMGIVFGFLVIMIVCISLVGKLIHGVGADKDVLPAGTPGISSSPGGASAGNAAVTAAISAAVNDYRKKNS